MSREIYSDNIQFYMGVYQKNIQDLFTPIKGEMKMGLKQRQFENKGHSLFEMFVTSRHLLLVTFWYI